MAKFKVDELWFSREISELINSMPQILIAFISRQFVRVISCMSTDLPTLVLSIAGLGCLGCFGYLGRSLRLH